MLLQSNKLGKNSLHEPNKRLRARILGTLRQRVQHRVRLTARRKQPQVRIQLSKVRILERRDVDLEGYTERGSQTAI